MTNISDTFHQEPTQRVPLGFQILLALATAGVTMSLFPVLSLLIPTQVTRLDPQNTASSLALVLAVGAAGALIGNPLSGALSDRTTSRLGRRRPWLLVGMAGSTLGLILLSQSHSIGLMAVAWFMTQFFSNTLFVAYNAILPDHVPVHQRGTTQSIVGITAPAAMLLGNFLVTQVDDLRLAYATILVVLVTFTSLFVILYRETQLPRGVIPPFRLGAFVASFWVNPRQNPRFTNTWVMWFVLWCAYYLGTGGFFFLYVQNITQYSQLFPGKEVKDGIAAIQMVQISVGMPLMFAAGVLSDRLRQRRLFVVAGAALIAFGLIFLAVFSSWPMVFVASVIIGAGFYTYYNLGLALISQLLPSASDRGKDLGVINIAATLPQIVLPGLAAALVNAMGATNPAAYQVLFIAGLGAACLGIVLLLRIRV